MNDLIPPSAPAKRPLLASFPYLGKLAIFLLLTVVSTMLFVLAGFLVAVIACRLNILADPNMLNDTSQPNVVSALKVIQTFSVVGGFVIPALVFAWMAGGNAFRYLGLDKAPSLYMVMLVIIAVVCASPAINALAELNSKMALPDFLKGVEEWMKKSEEDAARVTEAFLKMNGFGDFIIDLFIIAFLAAVGEELIFRGVLQNLLRNWTKRKHLAVWITAILFSAIHFQFYGFIPRMLLGVLLGYLYEWSGSLWLSILAHFLNNGVAVFFSYLLQRGALQVDPTAVGTQQIGILPAVISIVLVSAILFLIYKRRVPEPGLENSQRVI